MNKPDWLSCKNCDDDVYIQDAKDIMEEPDGFWWTCPNCGCDHFHYVDEDEDDK